MRRRKGRKEGRKEGRKDGRKVEQGETGEIRVQKVYSHQMHVDPAEASARRVYGHCELLLDH